MAREIGSDGSAGSAGAPSHHTCFPVIEASILSPRQVNFMGSAPILPALQEKCTPLRHLRYYRRFIPLASQVFPSNVDSKSDSSEAFFA